MAHMSSNGDGLLALSVANVLHVIDSNTKETILKYTNEFSSNNKESNDGNIIGHEFSTNKRYFAVVTGDKKLLVWNIVEKTEAMTLPLLKRPTCLCFCNKEDAVIVGDKSGDVYNFKLGGENIEPNLLLGHLSMVLGVAVSANDKFIISADRDEKIRVSFYPNAYSIHSYCLGHTELVSCLKLVSVNLLLSGSGDKTLRLWNFKDGIELSCFKISSKLKSSFVTVSKIAYHDGLIAVIGEGCFSVLFLFCHENTLTYRESYNLTKQPYDISFQNGSLFVLVCDVKNQIVVLDMSQDGISEKSLSFTDIAQDDHLSTSLLPDLKYLTELIRPEYKKRTNEEITPELAINYMPVPNKVMRIEA